MASRTDLNILDLPSIFKSISDNRRSGTLRIRAGREEKAVFFDEGHVQAVYSPGKLTLLGEALLRAGHIDEDTLDRAVIKQKASGERLGAVLIKTGKITDEDLLRALQVQISEEVCELFSWKDIHCEFAAGPAPANLFSPDQLAQKIKLLPDALVMEAARRMDELELIRATLPSGRDVPVVANPPEAADGSPQAELVALADGIRDVDDILTRARMGKFRAMKTLKLLVEKETLRLKDARELAATAKELSESRAQEAHGGIAKVIKLYERAEELGLKNKSVSLWLAKAYERTKQKKQSVTRYMALGRESLATGKIEEATTLYRRILDLNPDDHEAHQNLIATLLKKGEVEQAVEQLGSLVSRLRENGRAAEALQVAKSTAISVGDHLRVRELVADLTRESGDHIQALMDFETIAQDLADAGRLDEAVRVYERMLAIDHENIDAQFRLASTLTTLGRTSEAVNRYKALADMLSQSGVLESSINWSFLITVYEEIVKIEPNNRVAREWLGDAYKSKGDPTRALPHYNELVRVLADADDHAGLLATLRKILQIEPENWTARRRLAEVHVTLKDRSSAVRELRVVGRQARDRGEHATARQALLDATAIDPYDAEAQADLAEFHAGLGQHAEAGAVYRDLGHIERAARRFEAAARWFDRAVQVDGDDTYSLGMAGELLAQTGDATGAAKSFRGQPGRAVELGNRGEARRAVARLQAVAPNDGALPKLLAEAGAA